MKQKGCSLRTLHLLLQESMSVNYSFQTAL